MNLNPDIPTLYMTVGLVASGKTTFAYDLANNINADDDSRTTHVFDSDALREEMFGDTTHQGDNGELFTELHRRIKQCLKDGDNAVYCATNIKSKRRMAFLRELTNIPCNMAFLRELINIPCNKVCYIMATPYDQCLVNNENRERQVPQDVIERMYKSWQTPAKFEGWDEIRIKYWKNSKRSVDAVEYINSLIDFDQDNPHHTLSLGEHMRRTMAYMQSNWNDGDVPLDLYYASSLHDIGKTECRTYVDYKGRQCQYARYYNHENVGAYDVLFFDFCSKQTDELTLDVSVLINLHMKIYNFANVDNPQKLHDKHRKLWGDELYDKLVKLHEADINAK